FGGGDPDQVEHLGRFGLHLGFAFQLVDDLLGIWGDPMVTGKSVHSDLQNRKKTLPVVAALTSGTDAGRELAVLYGGDAPLTDTDLVLAAQLVARAGGRGWSDSQRDQFLAEAQRNLERAHPRARAGAELRALAEAIARRDH
ncbi:MAG TPA: polyprenyl synthetase family protein, partial [Acidimicrobiales bacterium]|nr:polyprenyl synthetase family protein [Acidimicrobiales bacterium]